MHTPFSKQGVLLKLPDFIGNFERDLAWPFPCPGLLRKSRNPFLGPALERSVNRRTARLHILGNGCDRPAFTVKPNDGQLALCWIGEQVPGLISPGLEGWRRTRSRDAFHVFMVWASRVTDVADLGNFSPGHGRHFRVQVNDELADLWWERF